MLGMIMIMIMVMSIRSGCVVSVQCVVLIWEAYVCTELGHRVWCFAIDYFAGLGSIQGIKEANGCGYGCIE